MLLDCGVVIFRTAFIQLLITEKHAGYIIIVILVYNVRILFFFDPLDLVRR